MISIELGARRWLYRAIPPILALCLFYALRTCPRIPFHSPLPLPSSLASLDSTISPHDLTWAPTTNDSTRRIPPYLHYVFGLSQDSPFSFIHFLCLSSGLKILNPEVLFFHHHFESTGGFWWEEFVRVLAQHNSRMETKRQTRLEMVRQRDVTQVFGNRIDHYAHKADVIRLEVLRDYGGVYCDMDVLVLRDLAPLYTHDAVMAMESQPDLDPHREPSGLCNAVILSKPFSSFVVRWLDTYRSFDRTKWATHSVSIPWRLARAFPLEVTVLNKFAFFWPIWHDDHLRLAHRTSSSADPSFSFTKPSPLAPTSDLPFTYHLWESASMERYLSYYTPETIWNRGKNLQGAAREEDGMNEENAFGRAARKYVDNGTLERWRAYEAGRGRTLDLK